MLDWICELTGATRATHSERLQSLWSGYGSICRVRLAGAPVPSVVVKEVRPPAATGRSHQRKLRSYAVERAWYAGLAARCDARCRVPAGLGSSVEEGVLRIVLEDLDAAGLGGRRTAVGPAELDLCLGWLASFHATFLGTAPADLWETGTYWHLATRPDELAVLEDGRLRRAAPVIDARLEAARHKTLVHGDAKLANFCFAADGSAVAAVDFQYVGGGVGMKDVVYLLSSCLTSEEQESSEKQWVDRYFFHLRAALAGRSPGIDAGEVEAEWRFLHPYAWADFCRFLDGWAPGHRHADRHGWRITARLLDAL